MRGDHHGGKLEERRLGGRLLGEDVEPGALHVPRTDRLGQGVLVDDAAAGGVDDPQTRLGVRQEILADQPHGLGVLREVDRHEIRFGHELLEAHQLHAHVAGPLDRHEGVVGDEAHPEGERALGHERTHPTEPHDAEGLPVELDAFPLRSLPLAADQGSVGLGDVARLGEQEGHRLLRGRKDVRLRRVDDHDAPLGRRSHVHVVEADAGPTDDDQVGAGREHVRGHGGGRADDQRLRAANRLDELFGGETEPNVDLVARVGETLESSRRQLFGHEHSSHGVPFCGGDVAPMQGAADSRRRAHATSRNSLASREMPSTRSSSASA